MLDEFCSRSSQSSPRPNPLLQRLLCHEISITEKKRAIAVQKNQLKHLVYAFAPYPQGLGIELLVGGKLASIAGGGQTSNMFADNFVLAGKHRFVNHLAWTVFHCFPRVKHCRSDLPPQYETGADDRVLR